MFCTKCGKQNPDGVAFCGECGAKLIVPGENKDTVVKNQEVNKGQESAAQPQQVSSQPQQASEQQAQPGTYQKVVHPQQGVYQQQIPSQSYPQQAPVQPYPQQAPVQPYQQAPGAAYQIPYTEPVIPNDYKPISMWGYFGYELLFGIPCIGTIIALIMSFASENKNVKNFARSYFCVLIISVVLVGITLAILGATGGLAVLLADFDRFF